MKRLAVLALSVGLVVSSIATAEAKKKPAKVERVVEGRYEALPAPVTGCNTVLGTFACLVVETRSTEAFFTGKVTDTHGQPVYVLVRIHDGSYTHFCGQTTEPLPFRPGSTLEFFVGLDTWGVSGDCLDNRVKTTGSIRVTLSNVP